MSLRSFLRARRSGNRYTTKWGIDATRPLHEKREKFEAAKMPTEARARVEKIVDKMCDARKKSI